MLSRMAHAPLSRATSLLLTFALLFTMVPTFVLTNPEPAAAADVIANGTFTSNLASWGTTETTNPANGTVSWSSAHGGSVEHRTTGAQRFRLYGASSTQTIGTSITASSTVTLSLWWAKHQIDQSRAARYDIWVDLYKPSGAKAMIWGKNTVVPGDDSTSTGNVTNLNVSSYFTETGTYQIRLVSDLETGDSGSPDNQVFWDDVILNVTPPTNNTTVGNGTNPPNATVIPGNTSQTVDAFSLVTDSGTEAVTAVSVLGSANTTSGSVSLAKVYRDNNSDGLLDGGDTLQGSGSFSGTTATVSGLSIVASTTVQNYVVAYDIASTAPHNATLTGLIRSLSSTNTKTYNDTASATLTVDAQAPAAVTQFLATDGRDQRVPMSWVNPSDSDFGRLRVLRRNDQYPLNATDTAATQIYDASGTPSASVNIVDSLLANNQTYYYAAFTRDNAGNWNNTVTAGTTADTGTPNAVNVGDSVSSVANATVKGGDTNKAVGAFTFKTTGGSTTVSTVTVTGSADTTQGSVSTVRLFSDAGTLGVLDGGDTTIGSASFSGNTATLTGLSVNVDATTANYLLAYDIAAAPPNGAQLTGYVSSATATTYEVLTSTDTVDATLTVDSQAAGTVTGFSATDDEDQQSNLAWTNPGDGDLAEIKVLRKLGSYPTSSTDGTTVVDDTAAPFDTAFLNTSLTNGTTYYYAGFTRDTVGNWNHTVVAGTTADTGTPAAPPAPTTTLGDGSPGFGNTTVGPSYADRAVNAFTLRTSQATDTVTTITVSGGGDTGPTNVSTAKLYADTGTIGVLDGETAMASSSFSGNTVKFTNLGLNVNTITANYLVAYTISAGAAHNAKLDGYVSTLTATAGNLVSLQDNIDATLTVDAQGPGTITGFNAGDYGDTTSNLSWTNPTDPDLTAVRVLRKTGSYPTSHTDGTLVVNDTSSPFDTAFSDTGLTNGTKYYYAAFAQDSYGNWNSSVVEGTNADTATPQALAVTFANNSSDGTGDSVYHGETNHLMQSFTLATNGGNGNWTAIGLSEYGAGTAATNVGAFKLYRDNGDDNFSATTDTQLTISPSTFSGESTTFTITGGETLTSTAREYYIVYTFADGATPESTVTVGSRLADDGSIIVTNGPVTGISPAKSSGLATLYPDTVSVSGTSTAPSPTIKQGQQNDFLRLGLTTDFGTAVWTGVTIDETGTAADAAVSSVKIYKSSDGTWEDSDTLVGSGTFSGGASTINFSVPNYQTVSSALSSYYFVVYRISETADVSATIGASVDSSGTIYLSAPDGISAFSSSSGAPEIEEAVTDVTTPTVSVLSATSTVASTVDLTWTPAGDPETGISGYKVYRGYENFNASTKNTSATLIAQLGPVLSFTDTTETGLITGELFYYAVSAVNGDLMEGDISNIATATVSGTEAPHYNFSVTTNRCRICHKLHNSPARTKVFRKYPEIQVCFTCHDGSGSTYNIQAQWAASAHNGTETALYSADTYIQCVKCHNPHGAPPDYGTSFFLVRRVEENLCFRCHSSTGVTPVASKNGWYPKDQMDSSVTVSRHAVISTTTLNGQGYYPEGTATTADGLPGARIECTNCHNPMVIQRGTLGSNFLVRLIDPFNVWNLWGNNTRGVSPTFVNFCLNCHNSGSTPVKTISDTTIVPYSVAFPSMSASTYPFFFGWDKTAFRDAPSAHFNNAVICGTCHNPHGSRNQRLMAFGYDANTATAAWDYYYDDTTSTAKEQRLCFNCHRAAARAGYATAPDVQTQFNKTYAMPVNLYDDRHRDTETSASLGLSNRHVECYDCHDPHKAKAGMRGKNNLAGGPLYGSIGVTPSSALQGTTPTYSVANGVTYEYEVCFKCHSSYVGVLATDTINNRKYGDKAFEFNPNNSAFMPVETTGHNNSTRLDTQLIGTMSTTSTISCTDCHNNNNTTGGSPADGWVVSSSTTTTTEAVGPHGSTQVRQLRASYKTTTSFSFSAGDGDLCFLCHSSSQLFGSNTNYHDENAPSGKGRGNLHDYHVNNKGVATCKNCHYNPHSNQQVQPGNTIYRIITSGPTTTDYTTPPATSILKTTRLINFSPNVTRIDGGSGIPIWQYNKNDNIRACYVGHSGKQMDLGSAQYRPSSGDASP